MKKLLSLVLLVFLISPFQAKADLTSDVTILDYGIQPVGTSTLGDVFISNSGTNIIFDVSTIVTGDGFSLSVPCATLLFPGDSCIVDIFYTPLAEGNYNGNLRVESATGPEFIDVMLQGSTDNANPEQDIKCVEKLDKCDEKRTLCEFKGNKDCETKFLTCTDKATKFCE